jgi:hypothetical protein
MRRSKLEEFKRLFTGRWKGWRHRLKNVENFFDDPVDNLKHKIHGLKIFGFRIRIDKWMRGKDNPDK